MKPKEPMEFRSQTLGTFVEVPAKYRRCAIIYLYKSEEFDRADNVGMTAEGARPRSISRSMQYCRSVASNLRIEYGITEKEWRKHVGPIIKNARWDNWEELTKKYNSLGDKDD